VLVTGLAADHRSRVTAALEALGVPPLRAGQRETRRTFTVVDASVTIQPAGPSVTGSQHHLVPRGRPHRQAAELAGFRDRYERVLAGAEAVYSGSLRWDCRGPTPS